LKVIDHIEQVREWVRAHKTLNHRIGFVPTMGALHEGHLSLVRRSTAENDVAVVSIFVNPLQFGVNEDLQKYPRPLEKDIRMLSQCGVDLCFHPQASELLGEDLQTFVDMQGLPEHLCGLKRPGHFRGVCTIVAKLFNIVSPDRAYFGRKDLQQLFIIQKMVRDLNFSVEIVPCPIVREADGLAVSSRILYLSPDERKDATILSKVIKQAAEAPWAELTASELIAQLRKSVTAVASARIDYIQIVDESLEDVKLVKNGDILALAVYIGSTRLIDNYVFGQKLNF
jgi:pantoate--beta-alanine ligase